MKTGEILKYILAFIVGVISVFITQFLITKLWNIAGVSWGPDNLPFEKSQQIGMLTSGFIAGVIGPCIAIIIARKKALILILSFLIIGLSIDLYASIVPLKPVDLWFRVAWVLSVPLQIYIGAEIGGRIVNLKSVQQRL
jgi:uncharacterized membrane protein YczE